jgi:hypothetical protein
MSKKLEALVPKRSRVGKSDSLMLVKIADVADDAGLDCWTKVSYLAETKDPVVELEQGAAPPVFPEQASDNTLGIGTKLAHHTLDRYAEMLDVTFDDVVASVKSHFRELCIVDGRDDVVGRAIVRATSQRVRASRSPIRASSDAASQSGDEVRR